jgi:alpha-tubulin suppressor-like RCC1 family protein
MLTGVKELVPVVLRRADALDVADVSFSASHGALLSSDGGLFTWGAASRYGELGHSSLQSISTPLRVESLFNVTVASISCGTARSAAVTEEGELFVVGCVCWRCRGHGFARLTSLRRDASALRDASQWVPRSVRIPGAKVRQVSCGPFHSALITVDGALYTWGEGAFGALGHGDFLPQHAPRRVEALSGYRMQQVSCGVWHTAATGFSCEGGEAKLVRLFTWGDGDAGQLGNGAKTAAPLPYAVGGELGGHSVKQVVCGARHTLALTELGAVFGSGHQGAGAPRATFAQLKGALAGKSVQQIACGDKHSLALLQGGRSVFSWGCGAGGRLGHGDEKDRETPTLVAALSKRDVRTVVCGPECSSAVCEAVRLSVEEKAALARSEDEAGWVVAMHPSRRASSVRPRRSLVAPDGEGDSSERLAPRSVRSASLPADGGARRGSLGEWSQVAILSAELSFARHEVSALRAELAALRTKVIN